MVYIVHTYSSVSGLFIRPYSLWFPPNYTTFIIILISGNKSLLTLFFLAMPGLYLIYISNIQNQLLIFQKTISIVFIVIIYYIDSISFWEEEIDIFTILTLPTLKTGLVSSDLTELFLLILIVTLYSFGFLWKITLSLNDDGCIYMFLILMSFLSFPSALLNLLGHPVQHLERW